MSNQFIITTKQPEQSKTKCDVCGENYSSASSHIRTKRHQQYLHAKELYETLITETLEQQRKCAKMKVQLEEFRNQFLFG